MTAQCPLCDDEIRARLQSFGTLHQLSDGSFMNEWLIPQLDRMYPGLFDLISDPAQWIGELEQIWFPVSPQRVANHFLHLVPVIAPLPFTATVVHVKCAHCSRCHHVVHIGINFMSLMSHLSAHLAGTGLSTENLADFIGELRSPKPAWEDNQAPQGVDRDFVTTAVAWWLCHELAHFASPTAQDALLDVVLPQYARPFIVDEINADIRALDMLIHRIESRPAPHEQLLGTLLGGVALALRTWNLMIPKAFRHSNILDYPPRVAAATPSPSLRWKKIRERWDKHPFVNQTARQHFAVLEHRWFDGYETKLNNLWEAMHDRDISF